MDAQKCRKRSASKRTVAAAGVLAVTLLAAACGGSSTASTSSSTTAPTTTNPATDGDPLAPRPLPTKEKMTIGLSSAISSFAPALLAIELGEFEKENLEVSIQYVPPQESLLLVSQGKLDGASSAVTAGFMNLIADGTDVRWVYPGPGTNPESEQGYWINKSVYGSDGVFQPSDLKGETVLATSGAGSVSNAWLWQYLEEHGGGIEISDLNFQVMASADASNAVKNGAAAVGQVLTPYQKVFDGSDCCEFLTYGTTPGFGYTFGSKMFDRDPAVGEAFVRALARTTQQHLQGPPDATTTAALAKVLQIPEENVASIVPVFDADAADGLKGLQGTMELGQDFFRLVGGLLTYSQTLTPDQLIDTRYVDAISGR